MRQKHHVLEADDLALTSTAVTTARAGVRGAARCSRPALSAGARAWLLPLPPLLGPLYRPQPVIERARERHRPRLG